MKSALISFSVIVTIIILLYLSPVGYVIPGVFKIYGTGHTTAFLDDYKIFDNLIVKNGSIKTKWNHHNLYNQIPLSKEFDSINKKYKTVAYLIFHKDSLLHESYYLGHNSKSKSNSFSMAKSMVTAMLGKAIEQGYISSLDQKVSDFYDEFSKGVASKLTVGDLASMSSGLDWTEKYYSPINITTESYFTKDLEKLLLSRKITGQPGKSFKYLSGNTQLLGMVIRKATGKSLSDYFSKNFWIPIEAEEEALWQIDGKKNQMEKAFCCFASNAKDFARFAKLFKNKGRWNGQQIIDSSFVNLSLNPRFENSPNYGYGWWLLNRNNEKGFLMRGHLGQYVIVFPKSDLIIVRLGHKKGRKNEGYYIDEAFKMISYVKEH